MMRMTMKAWPWKGKSPKSTEVYSWEHQLELVDFPLEGIGAADFLGGGRLGSELVVVVLSCEISSCGCFFFFEWVQLTYT